MRRFHGIAFVAVYVLTLSSILAQNAYTDSTARIRINVFGEMGLPLADFDRNMQSNGFGFGWDAMYAIRPESPVWIGIGMHTFEFDSKSVRYSQQIDGFIYEYREKSASRLFMIHALLKYQPDVDFIVNPYVQMEAGYHHYFTNTKIRDTDSNEVVDQIPEQNSGALGYALMAGLHIVPGAPFWAIDVRVSYFGNPSAEYLVYDSDLDAGQLYPIETFDERKSPVAILGIQLGGSLRF